jgi:hypothetical protein
MIIGIGTPMSQSNIPRPMDFLRFETNECLSNEHRLNSFRTIRSLENCPRLHALANLNAPNEAEAAGELSDRRELARGIWTGR